MKKLTINSLIILSIIYAVSCSKDFLDDKPLSNLVVPSTIKEFTAILDNELLNVTNALTQISADEIYIPNQDDYLSLPTLTERNAYVWNKDIYEGATRIPDWNLLYRSIYYANSILAELQKNSLKSTTAGQNIEGWARFIRAHAFYDLAITFALAYDSSTAHITKGIPIRLTPNIDELAPRSNLKETYDQIIEDFKVAAKLLINEIPPPQINRPSKSAAFGALARVYLSMNKYTDAEVYADSSLGLYDKLIDYNSVNQTSNTPFTGINEEILFSANQIVAYSSLTSSSTTSVYSCDSNLLKSYDDNDLRKILYFRNSNGKFIMKRRYGKATLYPFTGLATDEIFLIKAECAARRNDTNVALFYLNRLLINRYKTGEFIPIESGAATEVLGRILEERKKELVFRGVRWADIKRLNATDPTIVLTRDIGSENYQILPNSPRYALPIPDDEIIWSGIEQNER
jgi:hypothetical protein